MKPTVTCRKCGEPADAMRSEFGNAHVLLIYVHNTGLETLSECRHRVMAIDAADMIVADRRALGEIK